MAYDARERGLITVYDMAKETPDGRGAFRMVPGEGRENLSIDGKQYEIV